VTEGTYFDLQRLFCCKSSLGITTDRTKGANEATVAERLLSNINVYEISSIFFCPAISIFATEYEFDTFLNYGIEPVY